MYLPKYSGIFPLPLAPLRLQNKFINAHTSFTAKQFYNQFLWWQPNQAKFSHRPSFLFPFFPTCHPWQIRSQEKLTNIKNDVNFLKMPTCLQINSPVVVQILGEARFEGETMRRESAKIREKKKKQTRERENENFNPRKTPNTQAFLSCAELSCVRDSFPPLRDTDLSRLIYRYLGISFATMQRGRCGG